MNSVYMIKNGKKSKNIVFHKTLLMKYGIIIKPDEHDRIAVMSFSMADIISSELMTSENDRCEENDFDGLAPLKDKESSFLLFQYLVKTIKTNNRKPNNL